MKTSKSALITGIAGQDGAYLAELLLLKGYEVHGIVRWDSVVDPEACIYRLRALGIQDRVNIHTSDLTDFSALARLIQHINPDEIYNLGAMSHVHTSFETPSASFDINVKGLLHICEAVRLLGLEDSVRIYQASSSEMFGTSGSPQNEETAFHPCSPYAVAKLSSYWLARVYRESYGMHISNGILFNHESPLRGHDFVTQKICKAAVELEQGRKLPLKLGNLNAKRDWGHARDYVRGMWLMLQSDQPDDYVLATGLSRSVRDLAEAAFYQCGFDIIWDGEGVHEQGLCRETRRILITVVPELFRPNEVDVLCGDASKAQQKLGWEPNFTFENLIEDMVSAHRDDQHLGSDENAWKMVG